MQETNSANVMEELNQLKRKPPVRRTRKQITKLLKEYESKEGMCLRIAALTVARSKTPLGDYYKKIRGKLGGKGAVVATANKMARIIYAMLKEKKPYDKTIYEKAKEKNNTKQVEYHERMIAKLKKVA